MSKAPGNVPLRSEGREQCAAARNGSGAQRACRRTHPPYKLVHVLTHAYLVPEPCAHPRRTSTGRGNHRAAAWRALVQRYLSAQKGANFDGKKSDSKRGRIRAQRLPTQRGSYPRVRTAQESSPHMVGPRLKGIPTIRSDPPSGLL